MLRSIELRNWKAHGNSTLTFTKGTNIIIGQMGAGKSSILDAISFGLFGTFPAVQHRKVGIAGIIRNRPEETDTAVVKLSFDSGGSSYVVTRQVSKIGAPKATLEKDGAYVQSQPQRVNEEIEKALKIDYDLFSKAIYSEQNDLDYFLKLRASDRKRQIDELLGLDRFSTAQENSSAIINKLKDLITDNEKTAANFDIPGLKQQLSDMGSEMQRLASEQKRIDSELAARSSLVAEAEAELGAMKHAYQEKVRLDKEIVAQRNRIDVLSKEIDKINAAGHPSRAELEKGITALKGAIEKAKAEVISIKARERELQGQYARASAEISEHSKRVEENSRMLKELSQYDRKSIETSISDVNALIDSNTRETAECIATRNEYVRWISELERHTQKCPICERELGEDMRQKLIAEKKHAILLLADRIAQLAKADAEYKGRIKASEAQLRKLALLEEKVHEYNDPSQRIAQLKDTMLMAEEGLKAQKSLYDGAVAVVDDSTASLGMLASKLEAVDRRDGYVREVFQLSSALEANVKLSATINVDEAKLYALQEALTRTVSEHSRLSADASANRKYVADIEEQITGKKTEISKVERIYDDIKTKRSVAANMTKFKTSLQETQALLRSRLIDSINSIMHDVWPEIYPYSDYTSVKLEADSDDYVLKVLTNASGNTTWNDVDAIASGGERSIACLAMRVAFSLVLAPGLGLLILDEPTHNIDQRGLEKFVKMFNETLPRIVEQTFIITHDPLLKKAYNSKVYLLNRNKDENKEAVIEEL